jgi:hypothetical protein
MGESARLVTVTYNNAADADIMFISDYNLQNYVPIPLAGEEPVRSVTRGGVALTAAWDPSPAGSFAVGVEYEAVIQLTVENDTYRFFAEQDFAYPAGTVESQSGSDDDPVTRDLTVTYLAAPAPMVISDLDLTPYVPKPISNAAALMSFERAQYTGTVVWKETASQAELVGPFQADAEYTAEVSLRPAIGYSFNGVGQNTFTHTGAKRVTNEGGSGTVRLEFPPTGTGGVMMIGDTNLTNRIAKPAYGVTPVTFINSPQYTGQVAWKHTDTHAVLTGSFQSDTPYTAVVTLSAAPGYTLGGIGRNVFSHRDAVQVRNGAGSGTVTIDFPPEAFLDYTAVKFGPASEAGSALKILMERSGDTRRVTITLSGSSEEEVIANSVNLIGGLTSPSTITLDGGQGQGRKLKIDGPGALLKVGEGVTLTLRNIILEGTDDNASPLIEVRKRGKLILEEGARLTDNEAAAPAGGVWVKGGELVLNDGAVIEKMVVVTHQNPYQPRSGGGVLIDSGGRFTMKGGLIGGTSGSGNVGAWNYDAGGVFVASGSFTMSGGTITGNQVSSGGGGVLVGLGGTFTMDGAGAVISDNSTQGRGGGGVDINEGGTFIMHRGTIEGNSAGGVGDLSGGGVLNEQGTFTMNGGTIQGNTAVGSSGIGYDSWSGGGVHNLYGTFTMNGGTIAENMAVGTDSGGGVDNRGTFTMNGGTIAENTASGNNSGGGIHAVDAFTMNGGTIAGNTAVGTDSGGGVFSIANIIMNGGIITGNETQNLDNYGVFLKNLGVNPTLTMKGPARVDANNPVFLSTDTMIAISDNLNDDPPFPAAIIKHANPVTGTRLLQASSDEFLTGNIGKFQYAGGDIIADPANPIVESGTQTWYGVYQ